MVPDRNEVRERARDDTDQSHVLFSTPFGWSRALFPIVTIVGFGLAWPTSSDAAKLTHYLTSEDLAGRIVLDQNGNQISLSTPHDRHPALAKGSIPTYLAIPLNGGEHLPVSIPTLATGPQPAENPVGPLNFDSLVKTNLDATLAATRLAIVDTSSRNYLVEFLPRRAHSVSSLQKAAGTAGNAVNNLTNLLDTGQNQLNKLTESGMSNLEKFLHISSKTTALTPSLNLEAQVLNGDAVPATVPEPGTWVLFMGLLAWRCRPSKVPTSADLIGEEA